MKRLPEERTRKFTPWSLGTAGGACRRKLKRCLVQSTNIAVLLFLLNLFGVWDALSSPFAREFRYTQPEGTPIRLWGQGDEFHAVFETLEGYTVLFVPETRAYCYARVSTDGTTLEPTGARVGSDDPALLGLVRHQRLSPEAIRAAVAPKVAAWEQAMNLSERWARLKACYLAPGPKTLSPPSFQTTGVKCGLTVLIDFEDERATIPREEAGEFLNGENYTGFGNNGSVKQYYADNSNGRLTFTNVVTLYVTISNSVHPRSFYNDPTKDAFSQGALLVRDALNVIKALPNFTNDFLPLFQAPTVDAANTLVSANFFVAGDNSGVWCKGIWGITSSLSYFVGAQALWPGGKMVDRYQLSPMGQRVELCTFCHESGHLLCGFPDLYDYDYDSAGGAGPFCLMDYGGVFTPTNIPQFCAYLKAAAGWASVIDLAPRTNFVASLAAAGPGFNRFYRLRKPGVSTEYFLIENRQPIGRDASLPGGGIAVWHIDELGDKDNQSLVPNPSHLNFEVTLVQADNLWDFEYDRGLGNPEDLFYAGNASPGYVNALSDLTSPAANWWDGSRSGLELSDFSTNAETMTFTARVQPLAIRFDPVDLTVYETQDAVFRFVPATMWTNIQWYKEGAPLLASSRVTGVNSSILAISAAVLTDAGNYWAVIQSTQGETTTRQARLTVLAGPPLSSVAFASSGKTTLLPDGLDLTASGSGSVGGVNDSCRFACLAVSGDFDVRVFLLGISMAGTQTKAGLMARRALTSDSAHLSVLAGIQPAGPATHAGSVLARPVQAGPTRELLNFLPPCLADEGVPALWLRLKREGNRFTCYRSLDGSSWVWLTSAEVDLGESPFVGLALTAGANSSGTASASFRSYRLLTNTAPTLAAFTQDSTAQEGTLDNAQVAIYSSRNGPLEASLRFSGTAAYGSDYLPVPETVTIPAGTNVAVVTLHPMNDAVAAGPKTVEISLVERPGVDLVQPIEASVLILDDEQKVGGLTRQLYPDIRGTAVSDLTRQLTNANARIQMGTVTSFEAPTNAVQYGQVLAGYLVPPQTGNYVFYLASDENSELWLSADESAAHARLIARVQGYTAFRHYLVSGNSSLPIALEQGKYYYVKALHKQDWTADCFSVAWQLPGGSAPTNGSAPIAGDFLAFALPAAPAVQLVLPSGHSFTLTCATAGAKTCVLEASSNLETWEPVCTNSLPAKLDIATSDPPSAEQPVRYYRARLRSE